MPSIGMGEWALIFLAALLLFGAKRIPEIFQAFGKGIREFKKASKEIQNEISIDNDSHISTQRIYSTTEQTLPYNSESSKSSENKVADLEEQIRKLQDEINSIKNKKNV